MVWFFCFWRGSVCDCEKRERSKDKRGNYATATWTLGADLSRTLPSSSQSTDHPGASSTSTIDEISLGSGSHRGGGRTKPTGLFENRSERDARETALDGGRRPCVPSPETLGELGHNSCVAARGVQSMDNGPAFQYVRSHLHGWRGPRKVRLATTAACRMSPPSIFEGL